MRSNAPGIRYIQWPNRLRLLLPQNGYRYWPLTQRSKPASNVRQAAVRIEMNDILVL
jgi:hypothetical protein